jgi:hypothetical protein
LLLDAQLVSLHVREDVGLLDQPVLYALAVRSCPLLPGCHGPFVQAEGHDDGGGRTTIGQQRHDLHEQRRGPMQPVEGRAFTGREGLSTHAAAKALRLLTMHADVPFVSLPS